MDKPPMEWIDKLFNCLEEFYGERWSKSVCQKEYKEIARIMWQSALQGLCYEEIRDTLVFLKRESKKNYAKPPNHLAFYSIAKHEAKAVNTARSAQKQCDPEIARRAISEIRAKLDRSSSLKGAKEG
jgi:hypothetical protein